jgi:hypothetical protein
MISAATGFGAGANALKNKSAGKSQKLIAAVSIGICSFIGWLSGLPKRAAGTKAGCPQLSARGHPGAYGVVFALPLDQAPRRIQARADRATAKKRQGGRVLANVYEYTP